MGPPVVALLAFHSSSPCVWEIARAFKSLAARRTPTCPDCSREDVIAGLSATLAGSRLCFTCSTGLNLGLSIDPRSRENVSKSCYKPP